jgi:phosphopantothenoylcysteine synthetase/decarboxylase
MSQGFDANKFGALCDLLAPLGRTMGEHNAYITIFPGTEQGSIEFRFNWKTICYELEFSSLDDAINKSREIMKLANRHLALYEEEDDDDEDDDEDDEDDEDDDDEDDDDEDDEDDGDGDVCDDRFEDEFYNLLDKFGC